ncbi:MAG: hypothetical protein NTX86_04820 [Candidatus Dependentiae bacterium]|nr:hypothetical protein [Candidatus Dependentiae bacterium]
MNLSVNRFFLCLALSTGITAHVFAMQDGAGAGTGNPGNTAQQTQASQIQHPQTPPRPQVNNAPLAQQIQQPQSQSAQLSQEELNRIYARNDEVSTHRRTQARLARQAQRAQPEYTAARALRFVLAAEVGAGEHPIVRRANNTPFDSQSDQNNPEN